MVRRSAVVAMRPLLIAERESGGRRWAFPGRTDEYLADLHAGRAVTVSSAALMRAATHAGMPSERWAYAGTDWGKTFILDERDRLTEVDVSA